MAAAVWGFQLAVVEQGSMVRHALNDEARANFR